MKMQNVLKTLKFLIVGIIISTQTSCDNEEIEKIDSENNSIKIGQDQIEKEFDLIFKSLNSVEFRNKSTNNLRSKSTNLFSNSNLTSNTLNIELQNSSSYIVQNSDLSNEFSHHQKRSLKNFYNKIYNTEDRNLVRTIELEINKLKTQNNSNISFTEYEQLLSIFENFKQIATNAIDMRQELIDLNKGKGSKFAQSHDPYFTDDLDPLPRDPSTPKIGFGSCVASKGKNVARGMVAGALRGAFLGALGGAAAGGIGAIPGAVAGAAGGALHGAAIGLIWVGIDCAITSSASVLVGPNGEEIDLADDLIVIGSRLILIQKTSSNIFKRINSNRFGEITLNSWEKE